MTLLKLSSSYFEKDVLTLSRDLIGKTLITEIEPGQITGGKIVETEAYSSKEKACHAFNNKLTPRTKPLFQKGGITYVYLCYGIHALLNIVAYKENEAQGVLIRAIEPTIGVELMMKRRKKNLSPKLASGPGALTQALGITLKHNKLSLSESIIWIEESKETIHPDDIITTPRIGVSYAKEDALLPWRFCLSKNLSLSRPLPQ